MTTIRATMITDSISPYGIRLPTLECRFPRWIHAEGRTHRLHNMGEEEIIEEWRTPSLMEAKELSRNASSSRAIPVKRLIQDVLDDPAIPIFWGANQRGMQAGAENNRVILCNNLPEKLGNMFSREEGWLAARDQVIEWARAFDEAGYHKQIINRLLEPFSHITVVITATEWDNFFALRRHPDAEPHIHMLADKIWEAMEQSQPKRLELGQWHLPYVTDDDRVQVRNLTELEQNKCLRGLSVARCARTSYLTHDRKPPVFEDDIALHDKLLHSTPLHASPAEHQGTPDRFASIYDKNYKNRENYEQPRRHGNFCGWLQYRKMLPNECVGN